MEELNRHLRFVFPFTLFTLLQLVELVTNMIFLSVFSASVNNLQAKVDALEKSNTKLTEEVRVMQRYTLQIRHFTSAHTLLLYNVICHLLLCTAAGILCLHSCLLFSTQLAVANNRIITLQEDVERVKEESSYQLESRKVNSSLIFIQ